MKPVTITVPVDDQVLYHIGNAIGQGHNMIRDFGASVLAAGYRLDECRLVQNLVGSGVDIFTLEVCRRPCFEVRVEIGDLTCQLRAPLRSSTLTLPVTITPRLIEQPPTRGAAVPGEFRLCDLECETTVCDGVPWRTPARTT
jgi:hypothetical protein